MDQKDVDEALSIAATLHAEAEASYLARGRRFQRLSVEELVSARKTAMAAWAANPGKRTDPDLVADADAEFALRGVVYPHDEQDDGWLNEVVLRLQATQISEAEQERRQVGFEALRKSVRERRKH